MASDARMWRLGPLIDALTRQDPDRAWNVSTIRHELLRMNAGQFHDVKEQGIDDYLIDEDTADRLLCDHCIHPTAVWGERWLTGESDAREEQKQLAV